MSYRGLGYRYGSQSPNPDPAPIDPNVGAKVGNQYFF